MSHELRVSSPAENRWRLTAGAFMQRQSHSIYQSYRVQDLFDDFEVPGNTDTLWLTDQEREDDDDAIFGELTFDITETLSVTGGVRFFESENSLKGFFGYGLGFSPMGSGEAQCFPGSDPFRRAPCTNLEKDTNESGNTKRFNMTWHATDDVMLYATWSEGFRPGGINRRGTLPPYKADFLTNMEVGFKTELAGNRVRINGAIFQEDWDDFQYSFLGANGLTEIRNAGQARIKGLEADILWQVTDAFSLSSAFSILDAKSTQDYCGTTYEQGPNEGEIVTNCDDPLAPAATFLQAPAGQELPVQSKFKANAVGRYNFSMGGLDSHLQVAWVYSGSAWSDLRTDERELLGKQPSYDLVDLAWGVKKDTWGVELFVKNVFDERAVLSRFTECSEFKPWDTEEEAEPNSVPLCGLQPYTVTTLPRQIGLTFSKSF
jgi:iron complex outermembrane recepter protein